MKYSTVVIHLIACVSVSHAFAPILSHNKLNSRPQRVLFSSQWDDEDEEVATKATSFTDAGEALKAEEDKERMDGMDDYDANPQYEATDFDRVREAIKERTDNLGIEKSKVTAEMVQAAQERAMEAMANRGSGGLDLSQISSSGPRGEDGGNVPAMFYEPENEMTEEEMIEADPDGQLSIPEQVMNEVSQSEWPTPFEALKEVIVLAVVVVGTAALIIGWDDLLRNTYTDLGFIPKPEDIMQGSENMVLPDGWTSGMSEDDFMNFQDEVGSTSGAASSSVSSILPEL